MDESKMPEPVALIRAALDAGPTPGPWHHDSDPIKGDPLGRVRFRVTAMGRTIVQTYYSSAQPGAPFKSGETDNRFIATCNPAAIAEVLQHVAALEAQVRALEADAQRSLEERLQMAVDQSRMEQEVAGLRALLLEARPYVQEAPRDRYGDSYPECIDVDLLQRIDTALNGGATPDDGSKT